VGRRELNRARTEAALEDAALQLFAEQGFDNTSIADIADRAGVATRTFFNYFRAKEDVIFTLHMSRADGLADKVAKRPAQEPPLVAIKNAILEDASMPYSYFQNVRLRSRAISSSASLRGKSADLVRYWERALAGGLARRAGRDEVSQEDRVGAAMALTAMRIATEDCLRDPSEPELIPALARTLDDVLALIGRS
jgi:AcrR family transcriptional regulator